MLCMCLDDTGKNLGAKHNSGSEATKPLPKAGRFKTAFVLSLQSTKGWVKSANGAEGDEET